jgi:hypothetical protein
METPDWLLPYADPMVRERFGRLRLTGVRPGEEAFIEDLRRLRDDPGDRPRAEAEIMLRKNWGAMGSFVKDDRPRALDLLGFASQLVFNTFLNPYLLAAERGDDLGYAYGLARAHNRAMVDFCAVDRRLLAVGYVPLADFARARAMAEEAIAMGCKALLVASACPAHHAPSHIGLFPVWAIAEEAHIPIVLHVGGGGQLVDPHFFENGLPPVPDFTAARRTSARSTTWRSRPPMQMLTHQSTAASRALRAARSASSSRERRGSRAGCGSSTRRSERSAGTRSASAASASARASTSAARYA